MNFRPTKWILYSPVALLPFLAAVALNGRTVMEDVSSRAAMNLAATGSEWAKLTFDGRDASIAGDAPSAAAIEAAVKAVAGTYGVRLVGNGARVVAPPPAARLIAPARKASLAGITWTPGSDGKGMSRPFDPEWTRDARSRNRRVVIAIVK